MSTERSFLTDFDAMAQRKKGYSLDKAQEYSFQLMDKVDGLQEFITRILRRQERDYLKAMKAQMVQVNSQMDSLKAKSRVRNQEEVDELLRLRQTLEWVKEEAMKLETLCKKLKADCSRWKAKAVSLEDDRDFLEKQLKDALKDIRKTDQNPSKKTIDSGTTVHTVLPTIKKQVFEPLKMTLPNTKAGQYLSKLLVTYSANDPELFFQLESYLTAQEEQCKLTIAHYRKIMAKEKRKMNTLNTTLSSTFSARSDLEDIFFSCVKAVRSDILKRKENPGVPTHGRSKSTNLQEETHLKFSSSDKKQILELLVQNEHVLTHIYEEMFPHRAGKEKEGLKEISEEKIRELAVFTDTIEEEGQGVNIMQ